jgi:diguanylate cyclase (GGDEF)-like protein
MVRPLSENRAPSDPGPETESSASERDVVRRSAIPGGWIRRDTNHRESLDRLTRLVVRVLDVWMCVLHIRGDDGMLQRAAVAGPVDDRLPALLLSQAHGTMSSGVPLIVSGGLEASQVPKLTSAGVHAWAGVPLMGVEGEVLGVLTAAHDQPRAWSSHEIATLSDIAASAAATLSLRRELVQRRLTEERLERTALYDPLTGLPNRLLFMERLEHVAERARRHGDSQYAVLFLDLDRFKVVNDSLGHQVGDELLVAITGRLAASVRTEDTVARLGGDEFAVLLENIVDVADATRVAERIANELTAPVNLNGYEVFSSASIGIALSSSSYDRPEHLLRNADMAMYRAKSAGIGQYEVFDRAMHAQALARLQMETDLRRACERHEFHAVYQPVICLSSGRIRGFEALLRWDHPAQGVVSPVEFIPIAEETGLILPMGRWILEEACRELRAWQRARKQPDLFVAVNLSVKQFSQPDLAEQVRQVLRTTGVKASSLRLEITETVIVQKTELATRTLRELKELGVKVYMDDFGTGYSSLSYLHRLPLDALKIDRSFIGEMDTDERTRQLVRAILTLAQSVGVQVVAEGVASSRQVEELRALGCQFAQGFYFARPLRALAAGELLAEDPTW